MCTIIRKTKRKTFTGYKLLAMKDGKFYSSFTGQELKVGKVPAPPTHCNRLSDHWNFSIVIKPLIDCIFYNRRFAGSTSIFVTLRDCKDNFKWARSETDHTLVIVKVTIAGTIRKGYYNGRSVFTGTQITKFGKIYKI